MARLPRVMGRGRALEVLLSSDDIRGPDAESRLDACMASVKRPAAQERIKTLLEQGLQEPGDAQNRLGFHLGQLGLKDER
jgi:enoyl-CoA hydratase/carnithine racemase